MNASADSCKLDFVIADVVLTILYSFVFVLGLPLNCLALWVLISGIRSKNVLSVYMINLALADLLQLLTLPFWIHYFCQHHIWDLGPVVCASVGLGFVTNLYAKHGFLCLIALERYIGVVHSMKYRNWSTLMRATKVSISAWAMVALVCALGYVALREDTVYKNSTLCYEGYPTGVNYPLFKLSTVALSFFAPSLLMGFFYTSILLKLRRMATIPPEEKRRIMILLAFTVVTFFLISGPYQVTSFYKDLVETTMKNNQELCRQETSILLYFQVTRGWTTLGSIVNPLVYVLLSKEANLELTKTFNCLLAAIHSLYQR